MATPETIRGYYGGVLHYPRGVKGHVAVHPPGDDFMWPFPEGDLWDPSAEDNPWRGYYSNNQSNRGLIAIVEPEINNERPHSPEVHITWCYMTRVNQHEPQFIQPVETVRLVYPTDTDPDTGGLVIPVNIFFRDDAKAQRPEIYRDIWIVFLGFNQTGKTWHAELDLAGLPKGYKRVLSTAIDEDPTGDAYSSRLVVKEIRSKNCVLSGLALLPGVVWDLDISGLPVAGDFIGKYQHLYNQPRSDSSLLHNLQKGLNIQHLTFTGCTILGGRPIDLEFVNAGWDMLVFSEVPKSYIETNWDGSALGIRAREDGSTDLAPGMMYYFTHRPILSTPLVTSIARSRMMSIEYNHCELSHLMPLLGNASKVFLRALSVDTCKGLDGPYTVLSYQHLEARERLSRQHYEIEGREAPISIRQLTPGSDGVNALPHLSKLEFSDTLIENGESFALALADSLRGGIASWIKGIDRALIASGKNPLFESDSPSSLMSIGDAAALLGMLDAMRTNHHRIDADAASIVQRAVFDTSGFLLSPLGLDDRLVGSTDVKMSGTSDAKTSGGSDVRIHRTSEDSPLTAMDWWMFSKIEGFEQVYNELRESSRIPLPQGASQIERDERANIVSQMEVVKRSLADFVSLLGETIHDFIWVKHDRKIWRLSKYRVLRFIKNQIAFVALMIQMWSDLAPL